MICHGGVDKDEGVRRTEFLQKFRHKPDLHFRTEIAGIDGVKAQAKRFPMRRQRAKYLVQIITDKIRKGSVGGKQSGRQRGTFDPHGGEHRKGNGLGAFADAGNILY